MIRQRQSVLIGLILVTLSTLGFGADFFAEVGGLIGLSIHFNDCENGTREHQIGWIAGQAWGAANFGDLIFSEEKAAVDASGKLAATWGKIKSR